MMGCTCSVAFTKQNNTGCVSVYSTAGGSQGSFAVCCVLHANVELVGFSCRDINAVALPIPGCLADKKKKSSERPSSLHGKLPLASGVGAFNHKKMH